MADCIGAKFPKLTVTWSELKAISHKCFGWHNKHWSRKWEYPWVASRLLEYGLEGATVLDAGAGQSPIAPFAAKRGAKVYTVDSALQTGTGAGYLNYGRLKLGITSKMDDFCHMHWLPDGTVDLIVSVSVVEHIPASKRRRAWHEFWRVLRPGGQLILTVDLIGCHGRLLNKCDGRPVEDVRQHGTYADVLKELETVSLWPVLAQDCPIVKSWGKREKTTHITGIVAARDENEPQV